MDINKTFLAETKHKMLKGALFVTSPLPSMSQSDVVMHCAGCWGSWAEVASLLLSSVQGALVTMKQKGWDVRSRCFSSLITKVGPSLSILSALHELSNNYSTIRNS